MKHSLFEIQKHSKKITEVAYLKKCCQLSDFGTKNYFRMNKLLFLACTIFVSCAGNSDKSDAYGNFEAAEILISSEGTGKILLLSVEEGQLLDTGYQAAIIDTIDLVLKREQIIAQREAVRTKVKGITAQIEVQNQQKRNLLIENQRVEKLLKDQAATQKQMDDIKGGIELVEKQIESIRTQNSTVLNELESYNKQINLIEEAIKKCYIINPVKGTVLTKYAEQYEIGTPGKPLYKIADLTEMTLRVYIEGEQLPLIHIGQKVEVLIDKGKKDFVKMDGIVSWISSTAEFTPKIIQTKKERVSMVYAVKISVKNDGALKIGMPAEVNFKSGE